MDLLYIGDVKSKYESISTFSDASGKDYSLLGGDVGEAVVYSLARNLLFCMNKKLFIANGGDTTPHDLASILKAVATSSGASSAELLAKIAELEAVLANAGNDNALLAQITNLNAQIESLNNEKTTLGGQLASLRQQLANAQSGSVDAAAFHTQIDLLERQLADKVRIAEELRVELEKLNASNVRSDDDASRRRDEGVGAKIFLGFIAEGASINTSDDLIPLNIIYGDTKSFVWENVDAINQKIVVAYPAGFGELESINDRNGLDLINSFLTNNASFPSFANSRNPRRPTTPKASVALRLICSGLIVE